MKLTIKWVCKETRDDRSLAQPILLPMSTDERPTKKSVARQLALRRNIETEFKAPASPVPLELTNRDALERDQFGFVIEVLDGLFNGFCIV